MYTYVISDVLERVVSVSEKDDIVGSIRSPAAPEATTDVQAVLCAYFVLLLDGYRNCLYFPSNSVIPAFSIQRFLFVRLKPSYPFFIKFFQSQVRVFRSCLRTL